MSQLTRALLKMDERVVSSFLLFHRGCSNTPVPARCLFKCDAGSPLSRGIARASDSQPFCLISSGTHLLSHGMPGIYGLLNSNGFHLRTCWCPCRCWQSSWGALEEVGRHRSHFRLQPGDASSCGFESCSVGSPSRFQILWKVGLSSLLRASHGRLSFMILMCRKDGQGSGLKPLWHFLCFFDLFSSSCQTPISSKSQPSKRENIHFFLPFQLFFLAWKYDMRNSFKQVVEERNLFYKSSFLVQQVGVITEHLFFIVWEVKSKNTNIFHTLTMCQALF